MVASVTTFSGHVAVVVSPLASEYPSQSARFVARRHGKVEETAYSVTFGTIQSRKNTDRRRDSVPSTWKSYVDKVDYKAILRAGKME